MGIGALLFIPAAAVPSYALFLVALMILAGGITALQVAANPYVAVLGPAKTASSRLNLAQAFNSLGTTIAPYIGGLLILNSAPTSMDEIRQMSSDVLHAYRLQQASSIKLPYLALGLIAIALGIAIAQLTVPPVPAAERHSGDSSGSMHLCKYRHPILGAVGIFVYVGAEVSIGSFMVNYLSQPNIGNLPEKVAAGYLSFYWGGAMVGRFIGAAILQKVRTGIDIGGAGIATSLLLIISMLSTGPLAMWSIILIGFFN